jgi:hypothetical protein
MQRWTLWRSRSTYEVHLDQVPAWAVAVSKLTELVDVATRHRLCGSQTPEICWKIPVGRPIYEVDGGERYLVNSLASQLDDIFSYLSCLDVMTAKTLHHIPVTRNEAIILGWADYDTEEPEIDA